MVHLDFHRFASANVCIFCVATRVMRTYIHNAQSCCERLALADVDRCTAMKSERTISTPVDDECHNMDLI